MKISTDQIDSGKDRSTRPGWQQKELPYETVES
jgi:hypothetical protein